MQKDEWYRRYFFPHLFSLVEKYKLTKIISKVSGKKVLDAGCGKGWISLGLYKLGHKLISIDYDSRILDKIKYLNSKENTNLDVKVDNITKLSFSNDTFDTIVCSDVIEHVKSYNSALHEFNRTLKKNGKIIITIPNGYTFDIFTDMVNKIFSRKFLNKKVYSNRYKIQEDNNIITYDAPEKHINKFTKRKIISNLKKSGFDIISFKNLRVFSPYFRSFFSLIGKPDLILYNFIEKLDIKLLNFFPSFLASDWLIVAQKNEKNK